MNAVEFYKLISDDTRLKTLLLISVESELCVCELMHAFEESSQPRISRHLAQLKKANILEVRKFKQWTYYSFSGECEAWMKETLKITLSAYPDYIDQELARLSSMGDRPQRAEICCN